MKMRDIVLLKKMFGSGLPKVNGSDNDDVLAVAGGEWGKSAIKTINGQSILGQGNISVDTYKTFPAGWNTTGTTAQLCASIDADASAAEGMAFLGEVYCSDLPGGIVNGDATIEIFDGSGTSGKTICVTMSSGNTDTHLWQYTYWNSGSSVSGWVGFYTKPSTGIPEADLSQDVRNKLNASSYDSLPDKPISVTVTTLEPDTTGTTGLLFGQTIYKLSSAYYEANDLFGATIELSGDPVKLNKRNTQDITGALAQFGFTGHGTAFSPSNFEVTSPYYDFTILALDAPFTLALYGVSVPSAGTWALASVSALQFPPSVKIRENYEGSFLPAVDCTKPEMEVGRTVQIDNDGTFRKGVRPALSGVSDYYDIQHIVQMGLGQTAFPVGSVINVNSSTKGNIAFVVAGHNQIENPNDSAAPTMTLIALNGLYGYAFDETEAICKCTSGLAAGTYYFTAGGDTYNLTLQNAVPADGIITINSTWFGTPIDVGFSVYASALASASRANALETGSIEGGESGNDLEAQSGVVINGNSSDYHYRMLYGSNNWKRSAARQWLNGIGTNWWAAKGDFDIAPNYIGEDGFLGSLDLDFQEILLTTEQVTGTNKVYEPDDGTDTTYTTQDKIFLASCTEVNGYDWGDQTQGKLMTLFMGTLQGDDPMRVKYDSEARNTTVWWWLRSPNPGYSNDVRGVGTGGRADTDGGARNRSDALVPACVIG